MMHEIIIGFSGAIAMNLTVCKKTSGKVREETGVMIYINVAI